MNKFQYFLSLIIRGLKNFFILLVITFTITVPLIWYVGHLNKVRTDFTAIGNQVILLENVQQIFGNHLQIKNESNFQTWPDSLHPNDNSLKGSYDAIINGDKSVGAIRIYWEGMEGSLPLVIRIELLKNNEPSDVLWAR